MSDLGKTVYRDCLHWSNNDHCAKSKCNYCPPDCPDRPGAPKPDAEKSGESPDLNLSAMAELAKDAPAGVLEPWVVEGGWRDKDGEIREELAQINTLAFGCVSNIKGGMMLKSYADHIVALHNMWVRSIKTTGGNKA